MLLVEKYYFNINLTMKRLLVIFVVQFFPLLLKAGDGDFYVSVSGGALYSKALNFNVTLEKTLRYHHAWEVGLDYYNQYFVDSKRSDGSSFKYRSLLFEGAYKFNVVRYKNTNLRFRGAVGLGVNEREKFTLSVSPGFEYSYTTQSNIQVFIQEKTQISFWTTNKSWFRTGVLVGLKIPLRYN